MGLATIRVVVCSREDGGKESGPPTGGIER